MYSVLSSSLVALDPVSVVCVGQSCACFQARARGAFLLFFLALFLFLLRTWRFGRSCAGVRLSAAIFECAGWISLRAVECFVAVRVIACWTAAGLPCLPSRPCVGATHPPLPGASGLRLLSAACAALYCSRLHLYVYIAGVIYMVRAFWVIFPLFWKRGSIRGRALLAALALQQRRTWGLVPIARR